MPENSARRLAAAAEGCSIGYRGDGCYRSKDPANSIKVLKEKAVKENNTKNKENTKYTCIDTKSRQIQHRSITRQVP